LYLKYNILRNELRIEAIARQSGHRSHRRLGIRIGAQASVMVYTDDGFAFNTIGKLKMRLVSIFTYAYQDSFSRDPTTEHRSGSNFSSVLWHRSLCGHRGLCR
jgi:hypothetical protein